MANPAAVMSVSLTPDIKTYVQERVKQAHYGTPSEYIRALIREDYKLAEQERLEQKLLAGLYSGKSKSITKKDWEQLRNRLSVLTKKAIIS